MTLERADARQASWLLCRAGRHLCAMPLEHVIETMRVLQIKPLSATPAFVRGLSIIRGSPTPVIDTALLLDAQESQPQRMVTIRLGGRTIALLFETVLGVRSIAAESLDALPPLLQGAAGDAISAIGTLDAELLLFLNNARILPDALLMAISAEGVSP